MRRHGGDFLDSPGRAFSKPTSAPVQCSHRLAAAMKKHPHLRSFPRTAALLLAGSIAVLLASHSAHAASGTWLNTGATNGTWSTTSNWVSGIVPGPSPSETATFQTAVGTFGTSGSPILIDAGRQFGTITFSGAAGNYVIGTTGGNALQGSNGATIQLRSTLTATNAVETINAPLIFPGSGNLTNNSANGTGAGAGTLNFGGAMTVTGSLTLRGSNTNANTISGPIAGDWILRKDDLGTWVLTNTNTYTGNTVVSNGTLSINSIANAGVASAIGRGNNIDLGQPQGLPFPNAARLQFTGASGGSSNRAIQLQGTSSTIENAVSGQTLTLSGNVSGLVSATSDVSLGLDGAGNGVISGIISPVSNAGILSTTKSGTGTWTLTRANTYNGNTTISGGMLKIGNTNALGFGGIQRTPVAVTTVNSGSTLDLNGTTGVNEPISLNGTGIGGNGALVNNSSTPAGIGNGIVGLTVPASGIGSGFATAPAVVISGNGTGATATASLGLTTASFTSISGGTGWVTGDTVSIVGGPGSGATGTVTASGGALTGITVTNPGIGYTIAPTSIFRQTGFGVGATIVGNATNFTVSGIAMTNAGAGYTGTPTVTVGGFGGATPTLPSFNLATDSSIGGSGNMTISSVVSGAGLTKVGTGTMTLSGANTYTGNTTVHAGTLKLNLSGSISNSAAIIVGDAGSTGTHLDVTTKTGGLSIGLAQTLKGIGQVDGNTTHPRHARPRQQPRPANLQRQPGLFHRRDAELGTGDELGGHAWDRLRRDRRDRRGRAQHRQRGDLEPHLQRHRLDRGLDRCLLDHQP